MATKGRPPKPTGTKYGKLTVTIPPNVLERFGALERKVSTGLPAPVSRSDLVCLALERLSELSPAKVRKALAARRVDG